MQRVLTGITTTGTPHLGNYVGAIRPAIAASQAPDAESFLFLADLHALVKSADPARVASSTLEIAASWLALGLDPARVFFYRQSDIGEIPQLTWLLTCVTGKGLLNRAHAYKAAVDANVAAGADPDASITAGLYLYPVLMAADILLFNAHQVPVGRDQVQHIEIARDLALRFNHLYGNEYFVLPEARIEDQVSVLPGLDGRKMSKSYDNTIALWLDRTELRKKVFAIVTNVQAPGEPKDPDDSHLFQIYQAFASTEETLALREHYAQGIAWGEAKALLADRIEGELAEPRRRYQALIADPAAIERTLVLGAERARERAAPFLARLKHAVGLRPLGAKAGNAGKTSAKAALPRWLSFRERDGRFVFKLNDAAGQTLLTSAGFDSPAAARAAQNALAALPPAELKRNALIAPAPDGGFTLSLMLSGDQTVAAAEGFSCAADARARLAVIESALAELATA